MRTARTVLLFTLISSSLVACGSKVDAPPESAPADTANTATDGETDSAADSAINPASDAPGDLATDTNAAPAEETTCKRLVTAMCGKATENCCNELGISWLAGGCSNAALGYCSGLIAEVTNGRMTYDATQLEACAKSWEAPTVACRAEFIPYLRSSVACAHLFNGLRPPGADCTSATQCNAPPGAVAYCDDATKRCRASVISAEGSACNFTGSLLRYCDDGLYCDLTGAMPVCRKELAPGAACSPVNYIACGYSSTCVESKCAAGLGADATCSEARECSSWTCAAGKCTSPLYPRVDKGLCNAGTFG